jgi:hypothetical protein
MEGKRGVSVTCVRSTQSAMVAMQAIVVIRLASKERVTFSEKTAVE